MSRQHGPAGRVEHLGHAFVQAECVGRLVSRRQIYPARLRQVLARNLTLRHSADYAPDMVTQVQVARALQRTRNFFATMREVIHAQAC